MCLIDYTVVEPQTDCLGDKQNLYLENQNKTKSLIDKNSKLVSKLLSPPSFMFFFILFYNEKVKIQNHFMDIYFIQAICILLQITCKIK